MDRGGTGDQGGDFPHQTDVVSTDQGGDFSGSRSGIITARGTAEGLALRMDSRVSKGQLLNALAQFLDSRRSFLEGNEISIEWVGGEPDEGLRQSIRSELESTFNVSVKADDEIVSSSDSGGSRAASDKSSGKVMNLTQKIESRRVGSDSSSRESSSGLGLFGGIEGLEMGSAQDDDTNIGIPKSGSSLAVDFEAWDDPDARVVYKTLRSGQKIETEHTLIVIGDVNSGAELVAGGDIVVLGALRGVAHAGAYDETGGGRFIISTDLQPTQLRIGSIISRGSGDKRSKQMEIARVDGNLIIVEPYNPRTVIGFKR